MKWKEIVTDADVQTFLEENLYLHDSCILRAKYTTSTRVAENGSMYPFNDRCLLTIELQQQRDGRSCITLRFQDVVVFHIQPRSGQYESIIYDTTLVKKGGLLYWTDFADAQVENPFQKIDFTAPEKDWGTWVVARKMFWSARKA